MKYRKTLIQLAVFIAALILILETVFMVKKQNRL